MKTAEFCSPLHPDKICDRISDAILDACLEQDPMTRCGIEVMGGHGIITITGELTTKAYVDVHKVVRVIVGDKYGIQINIVQQSPEIAQGVDTGGAGDQGIMVGYACNDNHAMIPQELFLARSLCKFIFEKYPYDGKTQITLDDDGEVETIVASFQNVKTKDLEELVEIWVRCLDTEKRNDIITLHANPAGDWQQGGFEADTGLTGRKLMVDNYGPNIPIGGGCFSGKDATKVDRSGAYMARHLAVKLLKKHEADEVIIKLAYAIGMPEPVMAEGKITKKGVKTKVDVNKNKLTPKDIIEFLDLRKPQFSKTAEWGHFGNNFKWDE